MANTTIKETTTKDVLCETDLTPVPEEGIISLKLSSPEVEISVGIDIKDIKDAVASYDALVVAATTTTTSSTTTTTITSSTTTTATTPPKVVYPNATASIGTNVEFVSYWTQHWMFKDLMRFGGLHGTMAGQTALRGWASNNGQLLDLDASGWVKSLQAGQTAMARMPSHHGGDFVMLYDGAGTFRFDSNGLIMGTQAPGRTTFNVKPDGDLTLVISATDTTNYIRNIRIVPAAFESDYATAPFHPAFLERLRGFSTIRCMDLASTNLTTVSSWTQRKRPEQYPQADVTGIAIEHMIDLCNTLHADMWYCVPHLADDNYMRNAAELIKNRLNADLKLYVEWSNEVWNSQFAASQYAANQGQLLQLSADRYQGLLFFQARRSAEMFSIFSSVFPKERLVRVLAGQQGSAWGHEQMLGYRPVANGPTVAESCDAFAIAPYFSVASTTQFEADALANGLDWLLDRTNEGLTAAISRMSTSVTALNAFKVPMIAYEGGQHLVVSYQNRTNTTLVNLYASANRHQRMYDMYIRYLTSWKTMGRAHMNFSFVGRYDMYGSFPIYERQDQELSTAPKARALSDWMVTNPKWW